MPAPGDTLDLNFRLKVLQDGELREIALRELLGRATFVSVYLRNRTPRCDRQTATLARHAAEIAQAGFGLVAISRDSATSQVRQAAAQGIPFPLASDPADQFARAAGILVRKKLYGRETIGPARCALLLDPGGVIQAIIEPVDADDHGAQLLRWIAER